MMLKELFCKLFGHTYTLERRTWICTRCGKRKSFYNNEIKIGGLEMKKLLLLLAILLFTAGYCNAAETQTTQDTTDNKAVIALQKQPATKEVQKQKISKNIACIIIQINGKAQDENLKK